jgi:hypothetical protein
MKPTRGAAQCIQDLRDDYEPVCDELGRMLGTTFELSHQGGGCFALVGTVGGVRLHVNDHGDGDLSPAADERGYWVGFYYPDSAWTGHVESIVGDKDCRIDDLAKFVCFAYSAFLRGERHQSTVVPVTRNELRVEQVSYTFAGFDFS